MLRIKNLSNQYLKRPLRVLYGHTQATPYGATLDPSLRNTDGSFRAPLAADAAPLVRSADAFLFQGGLIPGTVVAKGVGESVVVHNGVVRGQANGVTAWGLLANYVGGTVDELGDENQVGVWYGQDAVVELLAPAFNPNINANPAAGVPTFLYAGTDGRLTTTVPTGGVETNAVALLLERKSASKILVKLNV